MDTRGWLAAWVEGSARRAAWVVLAALALSAGALTWTAGHLKFDTDRDKMLSAELPFRRSEQHLRREFPQFADNLVLVVDSPVAERARAAALALAAELQTEAELFDGVLVPKADAFLERHGLLYLDPGEIETRTARLAEVQPFLGRLARDPSLRGLFALLEQAEAARAEGTRIDLDPMLERTASTLERTLAGEPAVLSWQELLHGAESSADDRRQFLLVRPVLDYGSLFAAAPALDRIRELWRELGLEGEAGLTLRVTGSLAMAEEELRTVMSGIGLIATLQLLMLGATLLIALRSPRLVVATLLTLTVGLIFNAFFAAAAVGHLNLISVAFAVLYLGLGVDYAIHLCLRYLELRRAGAGNLPALKRAASDVGGSLVLCAATTAAGFFAFVPTVYSGVAELGLISGVGMFISLVVTLTLLPALVTLLPARVRELTELATPLVDPVPWPVRHRRAVGLGAALVAAGSVLALERVRFSSNPLELRDAATESVSTFRDLLATSQTPPWYVSVLAPDEQRARAAVEELKQIDGVGRVLSASSFVPADQGEKLRLLDELSLLLGAELDPATADAPPTDAQRIEALASLEQALTGPVAGPAEARLATQLGRLQEAASGPGGSALLGLVEHALLTTLPVNLERLAGTLSAGAVGLDDLPEHLLSRWISPEGTWRIEAYPECDLEDPAALRSFVESVEERFAGRFEEQGGVTGAPISILRSGDAVVGAFRQALAVAVAATALLLLVVLRSLRETLLVLGTLALAGALTAATLVLLDQPFNFANVIGLPLLLGMGVDSGIHIVHRARSASSVLGTSTARGVVFSSLTTLLSFANLALSPHPGTASLGVVLAIGILWTLVASLVVLPALVARRKHQPAENVP